ncbi:ribonuclease H-like domain-containing protein [Tanacetum coccineum]|uniref:Ribonuclease H-like domain-containing protein n=1 Tax=Tanacetum coccineum TaxID=301880 RepID=A0ABQ4ZWE9_9ASTR
MAKVANGGVDDDDDDDVVDLYEGNGGAAMVSVVKEMVNEMEIGSGDEDSISCRRNFAGKIRRKSFPTAGNPQQDLEDKGVIDSGCSRRMTGNKSYLTDYEEIDGGFVTFGRKDNMYSVDLNNVVPQGCLTYLFAKAIPDESNLWHRRLRHVNFKTMNKLVRGNLVRGKFDGKADEGFFVGFFTNSKAFRVFNSRTRIVEENLHVQFSENTPNIAGSGPNWLFDIDALTKSMNYKPVVAGNQSNSNASIKACNDAGKARMETVPGKDYILLPMWPADSLFSQDLKSSPDAGFKPSGEEEKKDTEDPGNKDSEVPSIEEPREDWYQRVNQVLDAGINNTNNINTASDGNSTNNVNVVSSTVNVAGIEVNVVDPKTSIELPSDPTMPELEDIVYSDDDEDVSVEADMNNLDAFMPVSPIPTTRIHKDHPVEQIIGDLHSAPQTRRMTENLKEHEPKKVIHALKDPRWIEAMQDELLNKKDERGFMIKNKARLVAQGYTQEEGIDYDEAFLLLPELKQLGYS